MASERIHIVPHDDGWGVKYEGKSSAESTHATQKEAIEAGRALAQKHDADLVVHRQDGTFRNVYSYEDTEMSTREPNGKHADGHARDGNGRHAGQRLEADDVMSVGSRISWGAVLAGAAVALTLMVTLYTLGAAAGMTTNQKLSDRTLFVGAMIWYTFSTLIALFVGGVVVSRCTAGEDKTEAMMYGFVLWGVTFVGVALLGAGGINVGSSALVLRQETRLNATTPDAAAKLDQKTAEVKSGVANGAPEINPTALAWWTFAGILLSLGAAVGGSLAGAGPTLVLRQIRLRRTMPLARTGELQPH